MIDTARVNQVLHSLGVDEAQEAAVPNDEFVTSNGIRFQLRPVPPLLIRDLAQSIKEPRVPKVHIEDKDTYEENPNDPAYIESVQEYQRTLGELTNSVLLTRGTKIIDVPDAVEALDGEEWLEDMTELGIEVSTSRRARYYAWLKYVALVKTSDFGGLLGKVARMCGITMESEVEEALRSFRSNEEGAADPGVPAAEADGHGDSSREDVSGGSPGV